MRRALANSISYDRFDRAFDEWSEEAREAAVEARRRNAKYDTSETESHKFKVKKGAKWEFGSGIVPEYEPNTKRTPFEIVSPNVTVTKKTFENSKPVQVPVRDLTSLQTYGDATHRLPDNFRGFIKVFQKDGKLIIYDGNHRAAAAWIQGKKYINAHFVNLDKDERDHSGIKPIE